MEPTIISLNQVVSDTVKLLGRTLGAEITVVTNLGDDLWPVSVDAGQMQQILLNLAINSRDAMPQGGELVIRTANLTAIENDPEHPVACSTSERVVLSVSDSGHGMTPAIREKIFEPFFTTKAEGKGTGLGLAMVYGIVKQNNGHIEVTSDPDQGTTFQIYFPRAYGLEEAPAPVSFPERGTETILIVEDQDLVREVVVDVLQEYGYTVLEAPNGSEALRIITQRPGGVDLIITDVVMPEMNGPELAQRVRTLHPDARILFITGDAAGSANLREGLNADIALVQKPFSPAVLATKVREVLDAPAPVAA